MWPLYDDYECEQAGAGRAELVAKQLLGGVERGYFEAFRREWKRIHDDAMRTIPVVDSEESGGWKVAKEKIQRDGRAMMTRTETINMAGFGGDVEHIPSVWDSYDQSKSPAGRVRDNEAIGVQEEVCFRPTRVSRALFVDDALVVDRLDREEIQNALFRLQEDGADLLKRITVCAVDPPECSFLHVKMGDHRSPPHDKGDDTNDDADTEKMPVQLLQLPVGPVRVIDAPCRRRTPGSVTGWMALQARAERFFTTMIDKNRELIDHIDNKSTTDMFVFKGLSKTLFTGEVEKSVDLHDEEELCETNEKPRYTTTSSVVAVSPRYAKFDGVFQAPAAKTSLPELASSIFKSIVKKNASLLLVSTTPQANEIGDFLRRANRANNANEHIQGGLRSLALPTELVMADESRVEDARVTISQRARVLLKAVPPTPISLTSVTLTIPSLWRHRGVLAHIEAQKTSTFAIGSATNVLEVTTSHPEVEDTRVKLVPEPAVQSPVAGVPQPKVSCIAPESSSTTASTATLLPAKKVTFKVHENVSTDELVMSFLGNGPSQVIVAPSLEMTPTIPSDGGACIVPACTSFASAIDQLARPAVWFLVRIKLLKVKPMAMIEALKALPLEVLASIIFQLQTKLRGMVSPATKLPQEVILETCFAFRHAVWLHSLRMLVEFEGGTSCSQLLITARIVALPAYQSALGKAQIKSLSNLYVSMGGLPVSEPRDEADSKPTGEPPLKKGKSSLVQEQSTPIRIICAMHLLERDELLDELSELGVSVVERELPSCIDAIVDEHNAIVFLTDQHFSEEKLMKVLTYELATIQVQFQKLWILLHGIENEEALHLFFAALTNFKIDVQTFSCQDDAEASHIIRGIIDACAETALSRHRILPRMWFARPFMLEEESQLERFLSSTRIMNAFAAQSVLHRLSFEELTTKSVEELKAMVGASLSCEQLTLLWRYGLIPRNGTLH